MLVKIYEIQVSATWVSDLTLKPILRKLFEQKGELQKSDSYDLRWEIHPSCDRQMWEAVFKGEDQIAKKELLDSHPRYSGLAISVSQKMYLELVEENPNSRITLKNVNTHDIDVDNIESDISIYTGQVDILNKLMGRTLDQLKEASEIHWNAKVQVPVNGWLNAVNEIMLQEDCCSDKLQGCLKDGWRLLAVCPQPDTRRPDYILGRVNTELGTACIPEEAAR